MALLKTVTAGGAKFVFRQNNNKLGLTVRDVKGVEDAWKTLGRLEAEAEEVQ